MTTVLMADDSALLREGLVGLLERQGYEIVGQEHCADALLTTIAELAGRDALPDVVITDVRMPPTMTNDGLQAAIRIKEEHPRVAVLVLSQYVSPLHAQELFALPAPPAPGGAGRANNSWVCSGETYWLSTRTATRGCSSLIRIAA